MFMNSENSKTSDPHRLLQNLRDKKYLSRNNKRIAFSNLSFYYTWKKIKMSYKNNKFEISAPTWNEEFELSGGSYSTSGIQYYFEYIYKKKTWTKDSQSFTKNIHK